MKGKYRAILEFGQSKNTKRGIFMDELQTAVEGLKNSNTDIRELALDNIGSLKPDNAFEIILPFLSDSNLKYVEPQLVI